MQIACTMCHPYHIIACIYLIQHLPPVRSTVSSSQRRKRKKKKDVTSAKSSKPRRIDSYDYNSWDKFDVVSVKVGTVFFQYLCRYAMPM